MAVHPKLSGKMKNIIKAEAVDHCARVVDNWFCYWIHGNNLVVESSFVGRGCGCNHSLEQDKKLAAGISRLG